MNKGLIAGVVASIVTGVTGFVVGHRLGMKKGSEETAKVFNDEITNKFKNGEWTVNTAEATTEEAKEEKKEVEDYKVEEPNLSEEEFEDYEDEIKALHEQYTGEKVMHYVEEKDVDKYTTESGGFNYRVETLFFYPQDEDECHRLIPEWDDTEGWDNVDCELQLGEGIEKITERWVNMEEDEGYYADYLYYVNHESSIVYKVDILHGPRCGYLDADSNDVEMTFPELV